MAILIGIWTILRIFSRATLSVVLNFIAPWMLYQRCPDCHGEGYIPAGKAYVACPECEGVNRMCQVCLGSGLQEVHDLFFSCWCDHGTLPRPWAVEFSVVADVNGNWSDPRIDRFYHLFEYKGRQEHD